MKTTLTKRSIDSEPKSVLSAKEAAQYMGISFRTLKTILNSGEIPYRRAGRRILILRRALNDWTACRPASQN